MGSLWKSYIAHRKAFAMRRQDFSFDYMRDHGIIGDFGYIAMAMAAMICLLFGGSWLWSMPWLLVVVEFVVISVAILGFGVAGLDTWLRLDHMWQMNHDPIYRKKHEKHIRELRKWLGETEWMVDVTREINELAASCRKSTNGVNRGRKRHTDSVESSPKLRVVGVSDVA